VSSARRNEENIVLVSVDALEAGDGIETSIEAHDRRSPQASHHGDVDRISRREFC
jgi:hypothetical protein